MQSKTDCFDHSGVSMVDSFSSPEPSFNASFRSSHRSSRQSREYNVLLQAAQSFAFRIPLKRDTDVSSPSPANLTVRLMNGEELPASFLVEWGSPDAAIGGERRKDRPTVKVWGVPETEDVGEWEIGVFRMDTRKCVGSVLVRVVGTVAR